MEFKVILKKIWKGFNSWRKRGMWFRVAVLLLIGSVPLTERLITPDHVPLINEFVWIACKAIRYGSEPRATHAHLHYLHAQKSRELQNKLKAEYAAGRLKLNQYELKLVNQNTLNANYNKLFHLAQNKKLIPANFTLRQAKKAMFDKALKFTTGRYDAEWQDIKKRCHAEAPWDFDGIMLRLRYFVYLFAAILPLPLIPVLPWFILCLTMGYCGYQSQNNGRWILGIILSVIVTSLWISGANAGKYACFFRTSSWRLISVGAFFIIWAIIGNIFGKRLYRWALKHDFDKMTLVVLLALAAFILLMPVTFFKAGDTLSFSWWMLPGEYLLFRSSGFAWIFNIFGTLLLFYLLFFIHKNYSQKTQKIKWPIALKYLIILLIIAKLLYTWYHI